MNIILKPVKFPVKLFLIEGNFLISYYNNRGRWITKYFIDENYFVVDVNSYNQNIPSSEYSQAIADCKFIVFSKEAMKELSMTIIGWDDRINKNLKSFKGKSE